MSAIAARTHGARDGEAGGPAEGAAGRDKRSWILVGGVPARPLQEL
ncbi:MAG: hypothetical protein MUF27_01905 [Acidobacteria bacterium]|nr:hypothetical protein [Acidobacteriota bacterium]